MNAHQRDLIFMFPGQSSRFPDMIEKLAVESPASAGRVAEASDILGRDLARHYRADNPAIFARNRDVQVGVFLATHLHLKRLEDAGITAQYSLGLSLGEYNHLVHIGALMFDAALRLIDARGRLYDNGPPGCMAVVFPIDAETVERAIADLGLCRRVVIGLYNSPRQQVLSGEREAVARLAAALEEEHLVELVESEPNIAMHAPAFAPVAAEFREVLACTHFQSPRLPYVPNVTAEVLADAAPDHIRGCLAAHVCEPVLWKASVDAVAARVPAAHFIEVGPGSVLHNLFGRGWTPGSRARTDGAEDWTQHIRGLAAELGHGA
jgi:[acyl-carrier-protein] S-malonyltransferase